MHGWALQRFRVANSNQQSGKSTSFGILLLLRANLIIYYDLIIVFLMLQNFKQHDDGSTITMCLKRLNWMRRLRQIFLFHRELVHNSLECNFRQICRYLTNWASGNNGGKKLKGRKFFSYKWRFCRRSSPLCAHHSKHIDYGRENVTFKMNSHFLKLCRVYSNSLKMSNVGEFPWSWFLGDRTQV